MRESGKVAHNIEQESGKLDGICLCFSIAGVKWSCWPKGVEMVPRITYNTIYCSQGPGRSTMTPT